MIFLWIGLIVLGLVALYLFAIMPRMIKRPDRTPFEGKLYAHRGLFDNESDAPENSLPAFARAAEKGFGIEFSEEKAKDILLEDEINLLIEMNQGKYEATAWGCDLTYDYVKINGDYRT